MIQGFNEDNSFLQKRNNRSPIVLGVNNNRRNALPNLTNILQLQKQQRPQYLQQQPNVEQQGLSPLEGNKYDGSISDVIGGVDNASSLYSTLGGSTGGYGNLISAGLGGLKGLSKEGDYKDGLQGVFGIDKNDSEIMQGVKGATNGALTGAELGGPVGAIIGGVLGLGSSFLDDM